MAYATRRSYAGAAPACTLTNSITAGDTSALLTGDVTNWTTTASGPFFMVIDPGLSTEEKVLIGARTGASLSSITRGQDGTTAASHSAGASCYPVFTAIDADQANAAAATLTTKGDLLATDGSALNRLAVGANGSVLMADSAQTNGVAWVGNGLSNRNVVINGAMQVAQRGTSTASITTGGYYTADRYQLLFSGAVGTWTQSVENDAPTGSGFRKSIKMLCTTADASPAAGDRILFTQIIEGQNVQQFAKGTASAKPFTLSFWVKSNLTGTYIASLYDDDNTRHCSISYTISVSGTWEKKTITFPADTTGAFTNDNGASLYLFHYLVAGTNYSSGTLATTWASFAAVNDAVGQTNLAATINNYWQVTGVQVEVGSVATPFEFEDIGTTLAKCQRYYLRYGQVENIGSSMGASSATVVVIPVPFPTPMRVKPTSIDFSGTSVQDSLTAYTATPTINVSYGAQNGVLLVATVASGLTQFRPYFLYTAGGSYLGLSAEL